MIVGVDRPGPSHTRPGAGPGLVRRSLRLRRVQVGLALDVVVVLVAVVGPLVAPHGAADYVGPPEQLGGDGVLFGTDRLGQDVWSRFLLGGRTILVHSGVGTAIGVAVGSLVGVVAAHARGRLDDGLMRAVDVFLAVPPLLLALVAMTATGPEPWVIVGSVALVTAPRVARVAHGAAVGVVEGGFVETSESMGESRWRVVGVDVLPNISGPLLVEAGVRFSYAIAIVSSLAFLGLGVPANAANWGSMVQENRLAFVVQPWGVLLPTIAIVAVTVGTGLVADGIARAHRRADGGPR